jgi:hypothetical protein
MKNQTTKINFFRDSGFDDSKITHDFIPRVRKPAYNCYDNKKIKNWTCDDFANYIKDNSSANEWINRGKEIEFLNNYPHTLRYLSTIPALNTTVYLYGVWMLWQDTIKSDQRQLNEKER